MNLDMSRWPERILVFLGVPAGQDPVIYRDICLGLVFSVATLVAISKSWEHVADRVFWSAGVIAVLAFLAARSKRGLLLGLTLIAGTRLLFAWATR